MSLFVTDIRAMHHPADTQSARIASE